jgi:hypothetical protein
MKSMTLSCFGRRDDFAGLGFPRLFTLTTLRFRGAFFQTP